MKYFVRPSLYFIFWSLIILASCTREYPESGVPIKLAEIRNKQITELKYTVSFQIPESKDKLVTGKEIIKLNFDKNIKEPLILDYRNPENFIKSVKTNNRRIKYIFKNEHIIIPNSKLNDGKNYIEIEFISGNRALNRNDEYLYTLFVPDRACTAFPCFDQPSLKATFQTKITVPKGWTAITNTKLTNKEITKENNTTYIFDQSEPISTYLFSFTAGKFKSITKTFPDRQITMYYREDDTVKVNNNINNIFKLQYNSLKWLENYTQIKYPFKKLDFIAIPSFQYSGMEHPGAILYRDSKLFLEKDATIREELDRANLIAHETSHMWFGDLVTMKWFSEVWLKEVFANFMAGKIVNPQYPNINHKLNFLINHYPSAYAVDRTKGANPIEQDLNNMKNAGTLYGNIIYHKAPIVMKHLEMITGEKLLQEGLQEYLSQYKYSNATWNDLITILDKKVDIDLRKWSQSWVYESGMPQYKVQKAYNIKDQLQSIIIEQSDPSGKGRQWQQNAKFCIAELHNNLSYNIELKDTFSVIIPEKDNIKPEYIFPNSDGLAYGYFKIDSLSKYNILKHLPLLKDPVLKCSMYISLWENMLNQNIKPIVLFNTYTKSLQTETNPQNTSLALSYIESLYWRFLNNSQRDSLAQQLENIIWTKLSSNNSVNIKRSYLNTFKQIAITSEGVDKLFKLWQKEITIPGLSLSEKDYTDIAFELAIRNRNDSDTILSEQYNRIKNEERKERFIFIKPAVSSNIKVRDQFFESLKDEKNREKEPWVADALRYLHHPLRSKESIKYIIPSLNMLKEIQSTGDIFFPKMWLDATFSGHSSIDAMISINTFLNQNLDYPENLKNKILQSSDLVFRSCIIKGNEE